MRIVIITDWNPLVPTKGTNTVCKSEREETSSVGRQALEGGGGDREGGRGAREAGKRKLVAGVGDGEGVLEGVTLLSRGGFEYGLKSSEGWREDMGRSGEGVEAGGWEAKKPSSDYPRGVEPGGAACRGAGASRGGGGGDVELGHAAFWWAHNQVYVERGIALVTLQNVTVSGNDALITDEYRRVWATIHDDQV